MVSKKFGSFSLGFVNLFIPLCVTCVLNIVGVIDFCNSYLLVHKEMAGRNDRAIANALEAVAHVMAHANEVLHANQNHNGGANDFRWSRKVSEE